FETYDAAIEAGITAARNRIDAKLQEYSKTSKLCARSKQLCEQSRVLQEALHGKVSKSRTIVDESLVVYLKMRMSRLSIRRSPLIVDAHPRSVAFRSRSVHAERSQRVGVRGRREGGRA